jgi:hypothetical protein
MSSRGGNIEKLEADKKRSDMARLRGPYRYTKYGLTLSPAFYLRESSFSNLPLYPLRLCLLCVDLARAAPAVVEYGGQ